MSIRAYSLVVLLTLLFGASAQGAQGCDEFRAREGQSDQDRRRAISNLPNSGNIDRLVADCGREQVLLIVGEARTDGKRLNLHDVQDRRLRLAMARLGDSSAQDEIIQDLGSRDLIVRSYAFDDARALATPSMIAAVAERLWDASSGGRVGSEIYPPVTHEAVIALERMVDDPPGMPRHIRRPLTEEDVILWKEWWLENKNRYQSESE